LLQFILEMRQVIEYFAGVRNELTKVTWPKRDDVVKLTLIVFMISAIVAAYVGALDLGFTKLLGLLLSA
jgi:preprotein translocase subunit SecE